jgi:hypothetical protein
MEKSIAVIQTKGVFEYARDQSELLGVYRSAIETVRDRLGR